MRPQHITAENIKFQLDFNKKVEASMRPQHITAENVSAAVRGHAPTALQ